MNLSLAGQALMRSYRILPPEWEFIEKMPLIASRSIEFSTPWFDVVANRTNAYYSPFYSLRMPDCVLAKAVMPSEGDCKPEPGIETVLLHRYALLDLIRGGEYNHALDLAALLLALARHGQELLSDFKPGKKG